MARPDAAPTRAAPSIREATPDDATEVARLLTQLGHATTDAEVRARWAGWTAEGSAGLAADRSDGTLAGLCTVGRIHVLHRQRPIGRLTALVVDAPERGRGIGRALVAAAEARLTRDGCVLLEVTSGLRRADAHAFYERLGYERTSVRLMRALVPPP